MAGKLVGREKSALFLPYGQRSRITRKMIINFLSTRSLENLVPDVETETYKYISKLYYTPNKFFDHIISLPASVILKLVYGYQVFDKSDYLVDLAEKLAKLTTEATEPGRWLVDAFPILQYLPPWFPGAGFITWAEDAKLKCQSFTRAPLNYVKEAMATEDFTPSFTSEHLSRIPDNDTDGEDILMYAAASMYSGGTDTIVSVMKLFFLMMARHPDIQKRAQDEVDTIIGENRIPNATDRPFLPYINCIIKELLRFNPVVPLVVHSPEKDDFFSGYLIPKGTWIMANVWHMTHDPQVYPYPDEFIPERFEDHTHNPTGKVQPDPSNLVFGFGRRICPGRQFSEVSLFLAITCTLWAFSINPKVDAEGNISPLNIEFTTGHTVHPKPFECSVVPRPGNRILLIKQVLE